MFFSFSLSTEIYRTNPFSSKNNNPRKIKILTWSRLPAKLVPTFADRKCHVVNVTDPYGRILGFLDRSHYFFFQVAPQLYSRGWVDPVPDPLLPRKFGSTGNRTRTSGSTAAGVCLFACWLPHSGITMNLFPWSLLCLHHTARCNHAHSLSAGLHLPPLVCLIAPAPCSSVVYQKSLCVCTMGFVLIITGLQKNHVICQRLWGILNNKACERVKILQMACSWRGGSLRAVYAARRSSPLTS
jgi:hypothetical protein